MTEQESATADLVDELRAVRDSVEELYILLDHIWKNRDELRDIIESLVETRKIKGPNEFPLEEALEMGLTLEQIRQAVSEGITTVAGLRRVEKNGRNDASEIQIVNHELFDALRFLVQEVRQPPMADSYVADAMKQASVVLEKYKGVVEREAGESERLPETITCCRCDAQRESIQEAADEGWTDITPDDGPSWNYLGLCPECREEEDRVPEPEPTEVQGQKRLFG